VKRQLRQKEGGRKHQGNRGKAVRVSAKKGRDGSEKEESDTHTNYVFWRRPIK